MLHLKRTVPLAIAFISGITLLVQYFVPHPASGKVLEYSQTWITIIAYVSLLLGVGSLLQSHSHKIRAQVGGWGYSAVTLAAFVTTIGLGFHSKGTDPGGALDWTFNNVMNQMSATMFSLLGFFIASAAFRAFRARSLEACLLLGAAVIIMLGQVPLGGSLPGIPQLSAWVLAVPLTAAKRAIAFGVALGAIATALRVIFGIERAYLGGGE